VSLRVCGGDALCSLPRRFSHPPRQVPAKDRPGLQIAIRLTFLLPARFPSPLPRQTTSVSRRLYALFSPSFIRKTNLATRYFTLSSSFSRHSRQNFTPLPQQKKKQDGSQQDRKELVVRDDDWERGGGGSVGWHEQGNMMVDWEDGQRSTEKTVQKGTKREI
jgi:hypothetical protein